MAIAKTRNREVKTQQQQQQQQQQQVQSAGASPPQAAAAPNRPASVSTLRRRLSSFVPSHNEWGSMAALLIAVVALPLACAAGVRHYLNGAHRFYDAAPLNDDSGITTRVTAMAWSPTEEGPLFIGTEKGETIRIDRDGTVGPVVDNYSGETARAGDVVEIHLPSGADGKSRFVVRDREDDLLASAWRYYIGGIQTARKLTAITNDRGVEVTVVAAPPALRPEAPQRQPQPNSTEQLMTLDYDLVKYSYMPGGSEMSAAQIFGVEDARVVASLPGYSVVIIGEGGGSVFSFDPAAEIGGVPPDQSLTRIGRHESAVVDIAVAAASIVTPNPAFATAAADGTVKVWLPLKSTTVPFDAGGDYAIDVAPPGRRWVRDEGFGNLAGETWQSIDAMSADGGTLVVTNAQGARFLLGGPLSRGGTLTLPLAAGLSEPIALSATGDRLAAFNQATGGVEIYSGPGTDRFIQYSSTSVQYPFRFMDFNAAGNLLTIITEAGIVAVLDAMRGEILSQFLIPSDFVTPPASSPDGSLLAICAIDGTTRIYNVLDGTRFDTLPARANTSAALSLAFSASGRELVLLNVNERQLFRYSVRSQNLVLARSVSADELAVDATSSVLRPLYILTADATRIIPFATIDESSIFDVATGSELARLPLGNKVGSWRASADASRIAAIYAGELLYYREEADPEKRGLMPPLAEDGLRISADGSTLLLREPSGRLHVADIRTETDRPLLNPVLPGVLAITAELAPDGSAVVVAGADGTIAIVDLQSGAAVPVLGHGDMIQAMAVSPDGDYLASASIDGRLRITDLGRTRWISRVPFAALPAGPSRLPINTRMLAAPSAPAATQDLILAVQAGLNAAGYGPVVVDGVLGSMTRDAIAQWQRDNGWAPNGDATEEVRRALESGTAASKSAQ